MKLHRILAAAVLLSLSLLPPLGAADVQFWEVFSLAWKPAKKLTFEFEKNLRYENSFATMRSDHTELGVGYKVTRWLEVKADYRFIALDGEKRHRVDGNVVLTWRGKAIELSNRARIQNEFVENAAGRRSELVFRDRVEASFRPGKRLRPFVGGEIFLGLNDAGTSENKYRLTCGLDWSAVKKVTLSLFVHRQTDLGEATNETIPIFGARFRYTF